MSRRDRMRRRSPAGQRCRGGGNRRQSVVRRYLSCLRRTTDRYSDTDSDVGTQLSSLLDHQHHQPTNDNELLTPSAQTDQIFSELVSTDTLSPPVNRTHRSRDGTSTIETPYLQLPTFFAGRCRRWHSSLFGLYDNLSSLTRTPSSNDELLNDSIFPSLFDADVTDNNDGVTETSDNGNDVMPSAQQQTGASDMTTHDSDVGARDDNDSLNSQTCHESACHPSNSSSTQSSSSSHRVFYFYDRRLRPMPTSPPPPLPAVWTVICPPAYDDIVMMPSVNDDNDGDATSEGPPSYTSSLQDQPPAYGDVTETEVLQTVQSPCAIRLAVRWNRNMRVERWASHVNWIAS